MQVLTSLWRVKFAILTKLSFGTLLRLNLVSLQVRRCNNVLKQVRHIDVAVATS